MLPLKRPLKFTVLGPDTHLNDRICNLIISEFPHECIGNSFTELETGAREIKSTPPDLIILHTKKLNNDLAELHNAFLSGPPPVILILEPKHYNNTKSIHPSIIHVMKSPIENTELRQSIASLLDEKRKSVYKTERKRSDETIMLSTGTGWQLLKIKDILRLNSDGNYITFHTCRGEKFTVIKTMKYFEQKLPQELFYRVHQSHIINFKHIEKVLTSDRYSIIMNDGTSVPLSKERKESFKLFLQKKCIT